MNFKKQSHYSVMNGIQKRLISYFENVLVENLDRERYFNDQLSLDPWVEKSIFGDKFSIMLRDHTLFVICFLLLAISVNLNMYFVVGTTFCLIGINFCPMYFTNDFTFMKFLKYTTVSMVHYFLIFGKKERNREIISFLNNNRPTIEKKIVKNINPYWDININNDEYVKEICSHFNGGYTKGLTRLIKERYTNNIEKINDNRFITSLFLTPNRKQISFETLQFISSLIYKELTDGDNIKKIDITMESSCFNDYNEQQLKRLFCTDFCEEDLFLLYSLENVVLPVFANFDELILYARRMNNQFNYPNELIGKMEMAFKINEHSYRVTLVTDENWLIDLSKKLRNCLDTKVDLCTKGSYIVAEIKRDTQLYGAVAFNYKNNRLNLNEIKGKSNKRLLDEEIIVNQILTNFKDKSNDC